MSQPNRRFSVHSFVRPLVTSIALVAVAATAGGVQSDGTKAAPPDDAVAAVLGDPWPLEVCPISGRTLEGIAAPAESDFDGRQVRYCCGSCKARFESRVAEQGAEAWSAIDRRIADAQRMHYPLDVCIVTGGPLEKDGPLREVVHRNRLVRLGTDACVERFRAEPDRWLAELDRRIKESQRPDYPIAECIVAGCPLTDGHAVNERTHGNRLVRIGCEGCVARFEADPATYVKKLDEAYAAAQRPSYPLSACVVGGGRLGGDAVELVAGTTLVRFCCAGCVEQFRAEPGTYLERIADARSGTGAAGR